MKLFIISIFVVSSTAWAQSPGLKTEWVLAQGKLTYHVHYPLKNVEGVSTGVKGKGLCDKSRCEFLIAVPLKSFESGDGNRDNHMLEVTKAGLHPMITVKVSFPSGEIESGGSVTALISMAGESHTYNGIPLSKSKNGDSTTVRGQIPLVLSDFKVERPALLTVKVDDRAPVDFELTWK